MKKILLTFSLAAMLLSAKAQQILITGIMYDPKGGDAPTSGANYNEGDVIAKGGFEYVQFKAMQAIDFSVTPYSVVFCRQPGGTTPNLEHGWAAGGNRTYKMNLTSGVVQKGDIFYVGGMEKRLAGFTRTQNPSPMANTIYLTADISSAKWIKTMDYTKEVSDPFIQNGLPVTGNATGALLPNSGNPGGVAIFSGIVVDKNTVPIDVAFFAGANPITSTSSVYDATNQWGYKVPTNDFYDSSDNFFAKGTNTKTFTYYTPADQGVFLNLGGAYNSTNSTWITPRSTNNVILVGAGNTQADAEKSSIQDIENGTLPVSLTSFTAKANKIGNVDLAWTTASEQNNSHFEVNRSTDGANFNTIDKVNGNGTTATVNNYSYTDNSPAAGVNYYQLKQIDFDGKSTVSKVVSAKVGLNQSNIKVLANKTSITVNYQALANGKASFTVYSVSGAKLATVQQNVNVGANQLSIPVQLGNSLHLLKVVQGSESVSVKF